MKRKLIEIVVVIALFTLASICFAAWDNDKPSDSQTWNTAASSIRANNDALEVELGIDLAEAHPYYQSAAPSTKPDGSTALDVDDNGRMWVDSDDNTIYVLADYSGPTWTSASAASGVTSADATFTLQNTDEEDSDGGRQSRVISKGEQSGGEATTLGYIEFSHDDTSDDEKGQFLIKVNDGDDGNSPSNQPIGYLSTGKIDVSSSLSVLDEDDLSSDDDEVVPTQQSVKAYIDNLIGHDGDGYVSRDVDGTPTNVYTKYLTGTLDADTATSVAHGCTAANILHVSVIVYDDDQTGYRTSESWYSSDATTSWSVIFDGTNIGIHGVGTYIQGNVYRIKIDYTL